MSRAAMTFSEETALRQEILERLEETDCSAKGERRIDRFRGCLIGGAIGDALGAPVEFMSRAEILQTFGSHGLIDFAPAYGRVGAITDDTQMSLFTADGLLRTFVRARLRGIGGVFPPVTDFAYARWLITQGEVPGFGPTSIDHRNGWLIAHQALFSRRAPGATCLSSLRAKDRAGTPAINSSKGCGGVMRIAPVGLFRAANAEERGEHRDEKTFLLGCELSGLTHGHVTGQLAAGYLAVLIAVLAEAGTWSDATARAWKQLITSPHHQETSSLVKRALLGASSEPGSWEFLVSLGEGWVAEEALAMSLYCAESALRSKGQSSDSVREALLLSINHGGDSDSTGSITGNILGTIVGEAGLPNGWRTEVELKTVVSALGEDLATWPVWNVGEYDDSQESMYWSSRYPGG